MDDSVASDDAFMPRIERLSPVDAPTSDVMVAQTQHGALIALDAATGKPLWRWRTYDHWTSAASAGERVFISSAASDRPVWVEMDAQPGLQLNAGPWWNLLTHAPRIPIRPSAVSALRAGDGALLWRVTLYSPGTSAGAVSPVYVADDVVITIIASFQCQTREVIALDAATGALRWSRRIGPLITSTGFFARSRLLWVADGRVAVVTERERDVREREQSSYALLDAATGAVTWQGEQAPAEPSAHVGGAQDGMVYTLETRTAWPHTFVRAARSDDGAEGWRVAVDPASGRSSISPQVLVRAGVVYLLVGDERSSRVQALHAATGRALWRWRSPRALYTLSLARQAFMRVQQAARTGTWRPLARDVWRMRWLHPIRPNGASTLDAAQGRLYVTTSLGAFAVGARDGRTLWHALPFVEISHLHVSADEA